MAFSHGCQLKSRQKRSGRWLLQQRKDRRHGRFRVWMEGSRGGRARVARPRDNGRAMMMMERSTADFKKGMFGGGRCSKVSNVTVVTEMKSDGRAATPLECQAIRTWSVFNAHLIQANSVTSASHAHHPMLHCTHHSIDTATAPCFRSL